MITALVVDDESPAVQRLVGMLEAMGDIEVIGTSASVSEAELFLRERTPDVVFLDMTMPGRKGLDLLPAVDPRTKVVFATAHESFAVTAFERGAVDYLLKPFDRDRLETTVQRLRAAIGGEAPHAPAAAPEAAAMGKPVRLAMGDKLTIPRERGRTMAVVPLAEVLWIEALQNCSRLQSVDAEPILVTRSLSAWEEMLPGERFSRVGRSLIVQIARIRATQWQSRDQTLLFFEGIDRPLPVGRAAAARLKEILRATDEPS